MLLRRCSRRQTRFLFAPLAAEGSLAPEIAPQQTPFLEDSDNSDLYMASPPHPLRLCPQDSSSVTDITALLSITPSRFLPQILHPLILRQICLNNLNEALGSGPIY
jgi:hypothetical protein